ncbi:MAG TPA: lytic transglycosylase domain-containing protein [Burkholderiales bacterium]|jgi:soluble lytic murein transglycosylase-like protein|nr:lytic transglycosylase domain-containing protein [Burkholderiales bacterium]
MQRYRFLVAVVLIFATALPLATRAGTQQYEPLSASVQSAMSHSVADDYKARLVFNDPQHAYQWLLAMSQKLEKRIPDTVYRVELLKTIHYEATRAGLDPQLVLGIIQVESGFKKYAVSKAGARGLMQVMPFWVDLIGDEKQHNLFELRTNLRFGCTILRHYLDIEKGNLYRALGRYNGSLGRPEYPRLVMGAWKGTFRYDGPVV